MTVNIFDTIYPRRIIVIIGGTIKDINKEYKQRNGEEIIWDDTWAAVTIKAINSKNECCVVMWFPFKKYLDMNTIVHESLHTMFHIYNDMDVKIDYKNQEPHNYFLGWIVDCVQKTIKDDKRRTLQKHDKGNKTT